ncbi:hypothetical protein HOLleu_00156 [Holothuria leucospilota]|uniref:Uncharacterized protein n=1 Tax=Holothuria leucospilota TaxID=206669 RepID=A0A9Q1CNJ7_HOLLE|nr:hypothetical protein HOLleu_00156 [Holothuria leucospilota]
MPSQFTSPSCGALGPCKLDPLHVLDSDWLRVARVEYASGSLAAVRGVGINEMVMRLEEPCGSISFVMQSPSVTVQERLCCVWY